MDSTFDFQGDFDPAVYLEMGFKQQSVYSAIKTFALENIHAYFASNHTSSQGRPLQVLDYGCGPVLAYDISVAGVGGEIVLAEYAGKCRDAIQKWLDRDPSAWDWSLYIKHVVQTLQGKGEHEVTEREESLRKAIKAIVPCDITQEPPIAKGFEGPYDVVMSMLCIENGCNTREDYKAAVRRISTFIKTKGTLILYSSVRDKEGLGYYHVGKSKVFQVALPLQFVLTTLEENGFTSIIPNMLPERESCHFQLQIHRSGNSSLHHCN